MPDEPEDPYDGFFEDEIDFEELDDLLTDKPLEEPPSKPAAKPVKKAAKKKPKPTPRPVQAPGDEVLISFVESIQDTDGLLYVGIDPGLSGAIGLLHPDDATLSTCVDIPVTQATLSSSTKAKKKTQTKYDPAGICNLFSMLQPFAGRVRVFVEEITTMPMNGSKAIYAAGLSQGIWQVYLYSQGFSVQYLRPVAWKKAIWGTAYKHKEKDDGRLKAIQIFTGAPLHRKKDHNRAEAMLIAEAGRLLNQGNTNV